MLADVAIEERAGIPIAHLHGEIDMSNAAELGSTLQSAIRHVAAGLVLDLTGTRYLDSAGLQFIFDLSKRLRDRGQRLELVVPEVSPVRAVLGIVNVESLARVSPTIDEAVARLEAHAADVPPDGA
ncbi:MAG: STAS domain-containing protein [Thermoleophilaceae bacterium]